MSRTIPLVQTAVRRPVAVTMITLAVIVFGAISYIRLPVDLFPPLSYPTLTVRTEYPGAGPRTVETFLSQPIEDALGVVSSLVLIRSVSRAGTSDVVLEFEWGTDMDRKIPEIREKIQGLPLPDEAGTPLILRYDPALEPILEVGLLAQDDSISPESLRRTAEEILSRELTALDGVPSIRVRGGRIQEVRVEVDEERTSALGLSIRQIAERIAAANINQPGGTIEEGDETRLVRTMSEFTRVQEIEETIVDRRGDAPVLLGTIARVHLGTREVDVITRVGGRPAVLLQVHKEADANLVEVARKVREKLLGTAAQQSYVASHPRAAPGGAIQDELARKMTDFLAHEIPRGMQIEILSDRSEFIRAAVREVVLTAIFGGFLAVVVLFLFLKQLSKTLIVGTAIPLSVMASFACMHLGGVSLNIMSLGGLALGVGMLVDNAIVVLESIHRCREEGDSTRTASVRGTSEVATAVFASTLTTLCVFFPLIFVEGIAGQIFRDQALTVVYSLGASLFVALFVIPTLAALEFSGTLSSWSPTETLKFSSVRAFRTTWKTRGHSRLTVLRIPYGLLRFLIHFPLELLGQLAATAVGLTTILVGHTIQKARQGNRLLHPILDGFDRATNRVATIYRVALERSLIRPGLLLLLVGGLILLSFLASQTLGQELIPPMKQGEFSLEISLERGTRIEKTARIVAPLEIALHEDPRVRLVYSRIGVETDDVDATEKGPHTARITVILSPGGFRETEAAILGELRKQVESIPEIEKLRVTRPMLLSLRDPIAVEIYSDELDTLAQSAPRVQQILEGIDGLTDVENSFAPGNPELTVVYDRNLLSRYGLTVDAVAKTLRRKIQGEIPTRLRLGDRQIDIRVRTARPGGERPLDLERLRIGGTGSGKILSEVARILPESSHSEIRRIRHRRAAVVTASVEGFDLGRMARRVQEALTDHIEGAELYVGGQNREIERSRSSLLFAFGLAIFLVYVVMASQFESFLHPLVILVSLPLAGIGALLAIAALSISLSILVGIGAIVLAGVVVNNAIVLIDYVNQLRERGVHLDEALRQATQIRFRPIMMTTATTVLGLLPLTGILPLPFGFGEGLELRAPLAITVMAGLLSATGLTLVVVPVVYRLAERWRPSPTQPAPDEPFGAGPVPPDEGRSLNG